MKVLIISALAETNAKVEKQVPLTKIHTVEIDMDENNITPFNLAKFITDNNIPDTAFFSTNAIEDYSFTVSPTLCYETQIPTTDKDKLEYKKARFTSIAFRYVFDLLTSNGYKRVGFNSGLLKNFKDTNVYDMYLNKEFDRLVEYYSLSFNKI